MGFVCSQGNDAGTTKAPAKAPFSWGLALSTSFSHTRAHSESCIRTHAHTQACLTPSQAALSCVNKSETSTEIQLPNEAAHPANKHTH